MPTQQNRKFTRLVRHAKKKIRTSLHGLRPSGIQGRFIAPRILLNSIPKAGTHLLENALEQFPLLRNAGRRTVSCWESISPTTLHSVNTIGKGAFLNAHLTPQPELFDLIQNRNIKVLFVIRDPRDIAVSHFKYVSNIDFTHPLHSPFAELPDDNARLLASIKGIEGLKPPIGEMLKRFAPWMEHKSILVCRFEDLIGPSGGGTKSQQLTTLQSISNHLDIKISASQLEHIADRTFSSKSSTFRQGKAGNWRNHFNDSHIAAFKSVAGNELIRYGYEHDIDW